MRDFEQPGRSLVMARNGMAATSHPLATLAAVQVLERGGNAMDAAITACAVQCVVEPGSTGVGGDCFALYAPRGEAGAMVAYDGSGWAPAAASVAALRERGVQTIARQSPHAVTVPGAVHAWTQLLRDHGTLALGDVLAPAIRLADEGYAVAPRCAFDWAAQAELLRADDGARALMLDAAGNPPTTGSVHRQPRLAETLRRIAAEGRDGLYRGVVAEDIVATLRERGGLHTLEDFAEYAGEYVTAISAGFRGYEVHECPPPGQGAIALLILKILERYEADGQPLGPQRLHLEIEATRLAYGIRDAWLADPRGQAVDLGWLFSERLIDELVARIDPQRAMPQVPDLAPVEHKDTVYICVVDKERNCASFINSIFTPFGAGIMTARTGVMLHNRGQGFSMQEGHANALGPRKRPLHTIIPGMLSRDGRVLMPFGVMGGHYQAMGHAHFVSKVIDYGLDMQTASSLPRVFPPPGRDVVEVEDTLPVATRAELERRGFTLVRALAPIGGAQSIWIDWEQGVLLGASDHRKDGCALGC